MENLEHLDKLLSTTGSQDDQLDIVIADALNRLSVEDREKVYHGIHGVCNENYGESSPEFIAMKLEEMQEALVQIKEAGKLPTAALELAEELSLEFVEERKLRTTILATDSFDAEAAAERLVHYFDFKFAMFGGEKLCKKITYEDLDEDDIYALQKGFLQCLPERDRAGRPVSVFFPSQQDYKNGCDIARVFGRLLWFNNCLLEEEEMPTHNGFIMVIYNVGRLNIQRLYSQVPSVFFKSQNALPVKPVAFHICFSNPVFRFIAQNLLKVGRRDLRERGKVHQGSHQEVKYQLLTYGIPVDLLPVNIDGTIKRTRNLEMISAIKKKEEHTRKGSKLEYHIIPYVNDVVFGKGGPSQDRPGNIRLKMTVDELLPLYDTLDKGGKIELGKQVVDTVRVGGGRFLSKDFGVWMVVSEDHARTKVATLFRNRRKVAMKELRKQAASKTSRSGISALGDQNSAKRAKA